jgi:hypothetical protein
VSSITRPIVSPSQVVRCSMGCPGSHMAPVAAASGGSRRSAPQREQRCVPLTASPA